MTGSRSLPTSGLVEDAGRLEDAQFAGRLAAADFGDGEVAAAGGVELQREALPVIDA